MCFCEHKSVNKAIFIDKDGDVNTSNLYKGNPNLMTLLPFIAGGLATLQGFGYKIILVSNQPGIAKGLFEETDLFMSNLSLKELFNTFNLRLDGFYYCPHHPEGVISKYTISCKCRKPQPGLYFQAARELNINLNESWMIGDRLKDVEAAVRSGCKTLLISDGNEKNWTINSTQLPDYITYDFKETAEFIISEGRHARFMVA